MHDRGCDIPTQGHALLPRCLWGCFRNESHYLTQFFLGCCVTTWLGFQGPGKYLGSGMVCFHRCKHMVFPIVSLWGCGITDMPGFPVFIFQLLSSMPKRLYLLGLINHNTNFTFLDSLCNSVHGQVHPSILSSSICWWPFLMARGFTGPLN